MSKGSTRRPAAISEKELAKRWEAAFGKKQATCEQYVHITSIADMIMESENFNKGAMKSIIRRDDDESSV
jgi:hypothetical protein